MTTYNVYANGTFWGKFEADTLEGAMQKAADEHGTVDIGEDRASTEGMTAEEAWQPITKASPVGGALSYALSRKSCNSVALKACLEGRLTPLDDDRDISAVLRDWISREALTQAEACQVLDVPRRTLQLWLAGGRVSHERILRAALVVLPRD